MCWYFFGNLFSGPSVPLYLVANLFVFVLDCCTWFVLFDSVFGVLYPRECHVKIQTLRSPFTCKRHTRNYPRRHATHVDVCDSKLSPSRRGRSVRSARLSNKGVPMFYPFAKTQERHYGGMFVCIFGKYTTSEPRCQKAKGLPRASFWLRTPTQVRVKRHRMPCFQVCPQVASTRPPGFPSFLWVIGEMASTVFSAMLPPASNGKNSALMLDADPMPMRPKRHHTHIMRKRKWRRNDCDAHLTALPAWHLSSSFEFSHHSGALRRPLKRVANSSPRSPDQQQRPPSHRPHWKLVRSHCHCPERRRPRDPSRSGHRWAMGATSPLPRPLSVADVLAVQNGTGFVRPVTHTSLGCTSASVYLLDQSVYKRPNHMQAIRVLAKKGWTLTNLPVARNAMRLETASGFADNFKI